MKFFPKLICKGLNKRFIVLILALFVVVLPLKAQGFGEIFRDLQWSARGTLLFLFEDNGNASAPMPILPSLGVGASYSFNELLAFEISLDIYGTTFDYDVNLQRVVAANDEFRSTFVLGSILGFAPVYRFYPRGDAFTIRAYGGLSLDLRLIFRAYGIDDNEQHTNNNNANTGLTVGQARQEISSYFWGSGRFIYLFMGGGMDFPLLDNIQLGFDLRLWIPVWRIWTGENLPLVDSFRLGIGFRLTF